MTEREQLTRRRFLRSLGVGSLIGASGVAVLTAETPKEALAFRFMCYCGREVVAAVPDKVGTVVEQECACGVVWKLTWKGDCFATAAIFPDDAKTGWGRKKA